MRRAEKAEKAEKAERIVGRVVAGVLLASALAGCNGVPPMRHRIEAGQESYVVFVANAPDGRGDLHAMTPSGSDVVQLTFTLPAEWGPALSPHGDILAFLRGREEGDTTRTSVWLLNLLNGAERELPLPDSAGAPVTVRFADEGRSVIVRTTSKAFRIAAPPAAPTTEELPAKAAAEAMSIRVGTPAFARVDRCPGSTALCVFPDSGAPAPLAQDARDATRWGADSIAYIQGGELIVRPLGPGRARRLEWRKGIQQPRGLTAFVTIPRVREEGPPGLSP